MANENLPGFEHDDEGKKNEKQKLKLLVLLLMMAVVGYIYFFTGLIKPREEVAKPETVLTGQIKKPLPSRPSEKSTVTDKVAVEAMNDKAVTKNSSVNEDVKSLVTPKTTDEKSSKVVKPADVKPLQKKINEVIKQQPSTVKQSMPESASKADKSVQSDKTGKPETAKVKSTTSRLIGTYTILLGEFAPGKNYQALEAKLEARGLKPLNKKIISKKELMHRLFVKECSDYDQAASDLEKLKKLSIDAFFIEKSGKYSLYAGSYLNKSTVNKEMTRLAEQGIKIEIQQIEVPVTVVRLTSGSYTSKQNAEKGLERFKKYAVPATVTELKK